MCGQVLKDHLVLGGKEQGLGVWTGFALLMAEGKNPGGWGKEWEREGEREKPVTHRELQMAPSHRDGG